MMALSLGNIPATGPAAPAAPPGVAPAEGAFAVLMPIADPTDPRHEPAQGGKPIGKDMPVDATAPSPLAWLTPPVSKPLPAHRGEEMPVPTPGVSPTLPPPASEQPTAIPATPRRIMPAVSRPVIATTDKDGEAVVPVVSPHLPSPVLDTAIAPPSPIAPINSGPITVVATEIVPATPPIAPTVSRPLPAPAGEAAAVTTPPTSSQLGITPASAATAAPIAPSPPVAAVIATPAALSKSFGATSPRDGHDLPKPVGRPEPSVAIELRPVSTVPMPTTPRIAPAALVFADAIHRAVRDDRAPATPDAIGLAAATDLKTHAVAATADTQHGALDLRQEQWPARMIERIDALRDAANANDTSIRLIPDALGKIDVSLKRDGDTVTVNFTAQQAETRQLLADAAPKLAELAEARGLKLAQNGADTAGQQQQRQQPATPIAATPRSAHEDHTESTDIRIA